MPGGTTKEIEIEFKMSPIPPSRDVPLDLALIPLDDVFFRLNYRIFQAAMQRGRNKINKETADFRKQAHAIADAIADLPTVGLLAAPQTFFQDTLYSDLANLNVRNVRNVRIEECAVPPGWTPPGAGASK